jgi:hypothetical protein
LGDQLLSLFEWFSQSDRCSSLAYNYGSLELQTARDQVQQRSIAFSGDAITAEFIL